ncbi:MFS transporter [Streptomyces sp. NBC_00445]
MVLSGVLTGLVDWRWVFFINLPLAAVPLLVIRRLVPENRAPGRRRIDWTGAGLLTVGLIALVNGLLSSGSGVPLWQSGGSIAVGATLLVVFVVSQARSTQPLAPLGFFAERIRALGNGLTILLIGVSEAVFFLVVLYNQDVLDFSPLESGLAWLPFCLAFLPGVLVAGQLLPRVGMRTLLVVSMLVMACGVLMFSMVEEDSSYGSHIMPAMIVTGLGFAASLPAVQNAALHGISDHDAGLGSGVTTTVQQVGGALGLATFAAIALGGTHGSHTVESAGASPSTAYASPSAWPP